MAVGRPTAYNAKMVKAICDHIASGKSLRSFCRIKGNPRQGQVFKWLDKYPEFKEQYAEARMKQAYKWADEIIDIADDGSNDFLKDLNGNKKFNKEHVMRTRIRIDTRKWLLCKVLPKVYGDKVDVGIGQSKELDPVQIYIPDNGREKQ